MVHFCNRSDIDRLADNLFPGNDRQLFAAVSCAGGKSICRGTSCFDGTFHGDFDRGFDRFASWDFVGLCDGGSHGSV